MALFRRTTQLVAWINASATAAVVTPVLPARAGTRRLLIAVVLALPLSAYSVPNWSVAITVHAPTTLADQAVQIRLDGVLRARR